MTSAVRQPVDALIREAASIFHRLGGMATKHLTIVGGLVPPLLVPGAAAQHLGSADLDLCLSIALTGGETANCLVPADPTAVPSVEFLDGYPVKVAANPRCRRRSGASSPAASAPQIAVGTADHREWIKSTYSTKTI